MLLAVLPLPPTELKVPVQTNTPAEIELPWPYDESALQEPRGYNHHGRQTRSIMRQVIVENTGTQPIEGGEVIVNGRDWRSELLPTVADTARGLYMNWTLTRSHAASGLKAAQDPWQMLRLWGYTLCGEDTKGLSSLLAQRNIAGRPVKLNGHVAGEYHIDGRWSVIDGDQNIVYFNLDNRTLAGAEEIRADPFLALRTKPFGRFATASVAASQYNAGLFEYLEPGVAKPFKVKANQDLPVPGSMVIYPGERLIYHYTNWPEGQVGDPKAPEWAQAAPSALRMLEWQINAQARGWKSGPLEVSTSYPVLAVQNLETGARAPVAAMEAAYRCTIPVSKATDRVSIWMQRSQVSYPSFRRGKNTLLLQAKNKGAATVRLLYDSNDLPPQPAAPVVTSEKIFQDTNPTFAVSLEPACDRIWWQIADEPTFRFVAPNLDQIEKASAAVTLGVLANTFLNHETDYYFRVKTTRHTVWSSWSEPIKLRVNKPSTPTEFTATAGTAGRVRLQWKGAGEEFAVFASNRLDFLPDLYADTQVVSMRGLQVLQQRPNQNRVANTKEHSVELAPTGRYWRVLARHGAAWSNPGPLLTLTPELSRGLPPPVVFQIRWTNADNADVYLGEERPLKP